jgi:hypothetical protein
MVEIPKNKGLPLFIYIKIQDKKAETMFRFFYIENKRLKNQSG